MTFATTIDQAFKSIESDGKDVVMRYDTFNDLPYMSDDGKEIYDEFLQKVWDKALELTQEQDEGVWPSGFAITQDQGFFGPHKLVEEFFGTDADKAIEEVNSTFIDALDRAVEKLAPEFHADLAYRAMKNAKIKCSFSGSEEVSVPEKEQHFDEENNLHPEGEFAIEYLAENIHGWDDYKELDGRCLFSFKASL